MSRVPTLPLAELEPDLQEIVRECEEILGFLPVDTLVMTRNPALLRALYGLLRAAWGPGRIDMGLKRLIGEMMPDKPTDFFLPPDAIADAVFYLTQQPQGAWTFELDVRPFGEKW